MSQKFAYIKKKYYLCRRFQKSLSTMPKQSGIYQIKGKFENRSYYRPKNMSTGVFRSINPTMSERVKKDANFVNTRSNAAEFGCATSWSGQTLGFLHELATITNLAKKRGDITTTALGIIRSDELHPFGQRTMTTDGWEDVMMGKFNQLPRLSYDENFTTGITFSRRAVGVAPNVSYKLHINIPSFRESAASLAQWGARYVDYAVYLCRWECGYYSTLLGKYYHTQLVTTEAARYASYNSGIDADILTDDVLRPNRPKYWFVKALVVCTPIAEVNDTEYPLIHLRSFKFFDIPLQQL